MILNELLLSSFPGKPAGVGASEDQLYVVTTTMTIRKNRRICNDSTMAFCPAPNKSKDYIIA